MDYLIEQPKEKVKICIHIIHVYVGIREDKCYLTFIGVGSMKEEPR